MIYVSAGSYVREIDWSQYGQALSSSVLAIQGTAIKGPINSLQFISSPDIAISTYGNPKPGMWLTYSLLEFLKRGNRVWANRVAGGSASVFDDSTYLDTSPYTTAARAKVTAPDQVGTQPSIDSNAETFTVIQSSDATYTGTVFETFDIQGAPSINDGLKISVSPDSGSTWYTDDIQITPNIYTASSLAAYLSQAGILSNSGAYLTIDTDGSGHIRFTVNANSGETGGLIFSTPASPDCYTELGILPTVIGTNVENFTITGANNTINLTVGDGAAGTVSDSGTIPNNIYSASALASWMTTNLTNCATYVTFSADGGRIKVTHNTPGESINFTGGTSLATLGFTIGATTDTNASGHAGTDYLKIVVTEGDGVTTHTEEFILTSGAARTATQIALDLATSTHFVASAIDPGTGTDVVRLVGMYYGASASLQIHTDSTTTQLFTTIPTTVTGTGGADSVKFYANSFGSWANYAEAEPGLLVRVYDEYSGPVSASTKVNPDGTRNIQIITADGKVRETHRNVSKCPSQKNLTAGVGGEISPVATPRNSTVVFPVSASTVDDFYNSTTIKFTSGSLAGQSRKIIDYDGATQTATLSTPVLAAVPDTMTFDISSPNYIETLINGATEGAGSSFLLVQDQTTNENLPATGDYLLKGGANGAEDITEADFIGQYNVANTREKSGMKLFKNSETLDINIIYNPGCTSMAVYTETDTICQYRGDVLGITDPPKGLDPQRVVDFHNAENSYVEEPAAVSWESYKTNPLGSYPFDASGGRTSYNSSYMCIYWPWLQIFDDYNSDSDISNDRWVPPGMFAAAQMAFNDKVAEQWFAPAGLTRGKILSAQTTEYPDGPNQAERDFLYGDGNVINPIVNFRQYGINIWGQRTTQRVASATDRINVRRMLLYARKLVATVTMYLVFEPNDSVTWSRFISLTRPIFEGIKNRRGLYDFRIVCDSTTNTAELINQNTMYGKIVMQPTKTAEIILTDLVLTPTGASFDEYIY